MESWIVGRAVGGEDVSYGRPFRGKRKAAWLRRQDEEIAAYVRKKRRAATRRSMDLSQLVSPAVDALVGLLQGVPGESEVVLTSPAFSDVPFVGFGRIVTGGLWGYGPALYRDVNGMRWPIGSSAGRSL
jgi:hypothetical protein